jgi:lipopolysaccharide/colanic/teichoic acid biosynthesis glycosyltransferase
LYSPHLKRLLDLTLSLLALLALSPVLAVLTVLLYFQNQGQPFFIQERPGYRERPFRLIKFKSMTDARDARGRLLPDKQRLTPLGAFIRETSLDELPQLFNVLKGDMSLVGPRPLLFKYLPLYSPEQRRRHEVKPGITGWAQVNGRNSISWGEKFRHDVHYVDHLSFALDVKILWLTLLKVLRREGVNQSAERPMAPFNGRN